MVYGIVIQESYLAVLRGESVGGVAAKVNRTGLKVSNLLLDLYGESGQVGEGVIRFFLKLGDVVRQKVRSDLLSGS